MSTIKTDNENLVLHAEGAKDVEIQTNGSTKLTVKSDGTVEATGHIIANTMKVHSTTPSTGTGILHLRNGEATPSNSTFGGLFMSSSPGIDYSIGKANVNSDTSLSFRQSVSGTELMNITSAGYVTTPGQPRFQGRPYGTGSSGSQPANTMFGITQVSAIGISLSNENRLTVPVTGMYQVNYMHLIDTTGNYIYLRLYINGAVQYQAHNNFYVEENMDFNLHMAIYLNAGDYVEFGILSQTIARSWAGNHSWLSMRLLG